MFLTEAELTELTGYQRPKQIKEWLDRNGYRYEIDRHGWPKVLRDTLYSRFGVISNEPRLNLA